MVVRIANSDDVLQLAEIHVRTWQAAYMELMPREFLESLNFDEFAQRWTKIVGDQQETSRMTFVADNGNRVVGFVSVGPSRDKGADTSIGEIRAIYVVPESWSTGTGRALMACALEFLCDRGYTAATLWVLRENTRARKFYENAGMKFDGAVKIDTRFGSDMHEVRYHIGLPLKKL